MPFSSGGEGGTRRREAAKEDAKTCRGQISTKSTEDTESTESTESRKKCFSISFFDLSCFSLCSLCPLCSLSLIHLHPSRLSSRLRGSLRNEPPRPGPPQRRD